MKDILSDTEELLSQEDFYNIQRPTAFMLMIFSIVGVFGNAIILIVYSKLVKLTTTQFLIFVIAIYDILTALVVLQIVIVYKLFWFDINNIYYCKLMYGVARLLIIPGALFILIITVVRYCHICRPQLLCVIEPKIKSMCIFGTIIGLLCSILDTALVTNINTSEVCQIDNLFSFNIMIQIAFFSRFIMVQLILVLLICLNILIIKKNYQNRNEIAKRKEFKSEPLNGQIINEEKEEIDHSNSLDIFFERVNENQNGNKPTDGLESKSIKSRISKDDEDQGQRFTENKTPSVVSDGSDATMKTSQNKINDEDVKTFGARSSVRSTRTDNNNKSILRWSTIDMISKISKKDKSTLVSDKSFKGLSSTTVMISVVSLVYVLSYVPITILSNDTVGTLAQKYSVETVKYLLVPLKDMYYLGCAANPIIYTFVNHSFRYKCRLLLRL